MIGRLGLRAGTARERSLSARTLALMVAKTVAFTCTFALPLILVRRLDQAQFGLYKQIFLVVGTAVVVLPLGFGTSSAFYFLPRERERQPAVIFNMLLFNIAVGVGTMAVLLAWPGVLAAIFGDQALLPLAPMIGALIVLLILGAALDILAVANQETTLATVVILASQLSRTMLLIGAAIAVGTVRALVWVSLAHAAAQALALLAYLRSRWPRFWRRIDWSLLRAQLAYALPLGSAGLLYSLQTDLHQYVVSHRFGPAAYAVYAVGCFQLPLVLILSESAASVLIPHVSALQKAGNDREILWLTARALRKLALALFPAYTLLLVTGPDLITFLFTAQYRPSWPIFAVNLTLLPLSAVLFDPIIRAYANQRYFLLRLRIVLYPLSGVALWVATGWFGLLGAITTVVVVALLERAVIVARLGRLLGVRRSDVVLLRDTGKIALAAAVAGGAAALVRLALGDVRPFLALTACSTAFAAVYAAAIAVLGVLTREERAIIARPLTALQRRAATDRAA